MGGRRAECTLLKEQLDEQRSAARLPASCPRGAAVTEPRLRARPCAGGTFKSWISASFSPRQQILQDLPNLSAFTGGKDWLAPPSAADFFFLHFYIYF